MQLTKPSLMAVFVLGSGVVLSGCSIRDGLQNLQTPAAVELEISPMPPSEITMTVTPVPAEPTQSPSTEVKDLEVDLKAVKFDEESYQ